MKTIITTILLVATLNVNAALPVSIHSVGKFKFLVESPNAKLTTNIYNGDGQLIHTEYFTSKKLFVLDALSDGVYRIEVKNEKKEVVSTQSFKIVSETKRELVTL
jgi:redox-regulated HSP33 family molecular chaperone